MAASRAAELTRRVLTDHAYTGYVIAALLVGELVFNLLIVWKVRYTEIDWKAYMQEVQGVLDGQWDYLELRGGTGPLVYPAGFVYVFAALHRLTGADPACCRLPPDATTESARCVSGGGDIRRAQLIFVGVYLATHALVLDLYRRAKATPPWALALLSLSLRLHSLYALRLFNDCVAMLLLYAALHAFVRAKWSSGALLYSLAISVKMNCILFAPAVAIVMLRSLGWRRSILNGLLFGGTQLLLAVPFLATNARGYLGKAFELSRVFEFKWTVNWKFLDPQTFQSPLLAAALLALLVVLLLAFAHFRWCAADGGLPRLLLGGGGNGGVAAAKPQQSAHGVLLTLLTCNFLGVITARTMHYQFYTWYFHALPFLLWAARLPTMVRLLLWVGIEAAFNVYPATPASSAVLQVCHLALLAALWAAPAPGTEEVRAQKSD